MKNTLKSLWAYIGDKQWFSKLPILFNFYSEYIFIEVFYEVEKDVSINGILSNLHSAKDTIVSGDTVEGLKNTNE